MENRPQPAVKIGGAKPIEFVRKSPTETPKRLILSIDGPPKSGKSRFCLTAPGPIVYHNLDLGLEGVIESVFEEKPDLELYEFAYSVPFTAALPGSPFVALSDEARKVWDEFVRQFRAGIAQKRTTVVDTGTEAWSLARLARLGKLTQVLPHQYVAVNAEFRQLSQLALTNTTSNVIYTHKVKAVYKNEQKTEETEKAGFSEIDYDVQAVLRTDRDESKTGVEQFSIVLQECRANFAATGTRLVGRDCTFQKVATTIFPKTKVEDWQ